MNTSVSASTAVKALLHKTKTKQGRLVGVLDAKSAQALSNKFRLGRWSASDLAKVAEFTGAKLAFILPDGEQVVIAADALGETMPGGGIEASAGAGVTPTNISKSEKD